MKNKLDIKSTVLGIALGAIIMLSVGAAATQTPSMGRYRLVVFEASASSSAFLFKIDTATGQIWKTSPYTPSAEFMAPTAGN